MIISCPVSLHPHPPAPWLEDKGQSQHWKHSGMHCTRWPSAWLFFTLTGHWALGEEGLINTGRSLEKGRLSLCHTLDRRGLSQHNRSCLPLIIQVDLDFVCLQVVGLPQSVPWPLIRLHTNPTHSVPAHSPNTHCPKNQSSFIRYFGGMSPCAHALFCSQATVSNHNGLRTLYHHMS